MLADMWYKFDILFFQSDDPDYIEKSKVEAESIRKLKSLFKGLKFFLGREVPREELTFVIRLFSDQYYCSISIHYSIQKKIPYQCHTIHI